MPGSLLEIISGQDPSLRDTPLTHAVAGLDTAALLSHCAALHTFARESPNLYHRVRALFFLHALYRFHLPDGLPPGGIIPKDAHRALSERRFGEAIARLRTECERSGPTAPLSSALAAACRARGFELLGDQVRRSVRAVPGNEWLFESEARRLSVRPELREGRVALLERTPVRMDLSHSAWSDIFFLGMDAPEAARVLNVSIDLAVHGRDPAPRPPVEVRVRLLDEPGLRLRSLDLDASVTLARIEGVFDFGADALGLLRAGVIAAGLVPPSLEGDRGDLTPHLEALAGPGRGFEIETHVRGIPKGSRLAVSTSLLACLIAACMRATGQTRALEGPLEEPERRLVAARAILGEWLGGSGGGWQDSGGVWPGIKRIEGALAVPGDPEHGVSRGRLLPDHTLLEGGRVSASLRDALQRSLVLVHGGMAQDVGPILERVTEKYLLRSEPEWTARGEAVAIYDEILDAVEHGDVRRIAAATDRNFHGPLRTIIPEAANAYSDALIAGMRAAFGSDFWGFWMLGGMSGGGMGFWVAPERREEAGERVLALMRETRHRFRDAVPFAMEPVVYDFAINDAGTAANITSIESIAPTPMAAPAPARESRDLDTILAELGFDPSRHERVREDLRAGRIGLAQNRLADTVRIEDARPGDVEDARECDRFADAGHRALGEGRVGVVTLAAGVGSRWTRGAGVVKALTPLCEIAGAHRSFLEIHLAKTRRSGRLAGLALPHVITTSHATDAPIAHAVGALPGPSGMIVLTSPGRSIGHRLVPTERDLRFASAQRARQRLEPQAERVRESAEAALLAWVRERGEASDYHDPNAPLQCLHPVGHWFEIPNLLRNGVLLALLRQRPQLETLLLHNVDTLGAWVDPRLLGWFRAQDAAAAFEVVDRWYGDEGGGLARVDGVLRLVEGLALPDPELERSLSHYNSMTTWIDVDRLLAGFGLDREALADEARVARATDTLADRVPTYVTLKDVKRRWGHGQEDVLPVTQFEKLWSDLTTLPELACRYLRVPRRRGQQLKDPAQLDGWLRDGSRDAVAALCEWDPSS